jgi:hypothetical protein
MDLVTPAIAGAARTQRAGSHTGYHPPPLARRPHHVHLLFEHAGG